MKIIIEGRGMVDENRSRSLLAAFGPGIIYAASAVGISHLVNSSRAGADYGFTMTSVIVLICLLKYPALRFGAVYSAATGNSLIESYVKQGRWIAYIYIVVSLFTMFFVSASLGLVTAGLFKALVGVDWSALPIAVCVLILGSISLLFGHYRLLESVSKILVPFFSVCIFVAVLIMSTKISWAETSFMMPTMDVKTIFFIIVLAGFMPTPLDGSVLQSSWTCAKAKDAGQRFSEEKVLQDFNIGYFLSVFLAFAFLLMGAGVLYQSGNTLSANAGEFSNQIIGLFTTAIGEWAYMLVALSAFTVILSTLLTVQDGYPRVVADAVERLVSKDGSKREDDKYFNAMIIVNVVGAIAILFFFMRSFQAFINLSSTLVFVTGPLYAILNHRAVFSSDVPDASRPGDVLKYWSLLGILVMLAIGLLYFYLQWSG